MVIKGSASASVPGKAGRDALLSTVRRAAGSTGVRLSMPAPHALAVDALTDAPPEQYLPPVLPLGDYALTVDPDGHLVAYHLPTGTRSVLMELPVPSTTTQDGEH